MNEELIKEIFELKKQKEDLEQKQEEYKIQINNLNATIDLKEKDLLNAMKAADTKEIDLTDIVATYFSKENVSYTSDAAVLSYLKENNYNDLITTKTTESLNKNALKKALKTDLNLSKALEDLTVTNLTEWVVVTTKENHDKMLEHIEQNKKEK